MTEPTWQTYAEECREPHELRVGYEAEKVWRRAFELLASKTNLIDTRLAFAQAWRETHHGET